MSTRLSNKCPSFTQELRTRAPSKTMHYSSTFDDQSDRKALDALVEKIINTSATHGKSAQAQNSSPSSSKYKQLTMSKFCVNKNSKNEMSSATKSASKVQTGAENKPDSKKNVRGRRKNETSSKKVSNGKVNKKTNNKSNTTKLTSFNGWLSKTNRPSGNSTAVENVGSKVKSNKPISTEILEDNKTSMDSKVKKTGKSLKRQSSGSFAKYGMGVLSFDDIIAYQKKIENEKQYMDSLDIMEDSQESLDLNIEEPQVPDVVLDCKHLSDNEIKEAFKRNYRYIYDIFHGIRYSSRHEQFKKQDNYKDQFTTKDLKFNTSMSVFTYEQKQVLLSRLHKKFDNEKDFCKNNQYFFKVLLPELCMKIFMDVHNMGYDEAAAYLEVRPVVN